MLTLNMIFNNFKCALAVTLEQNLFSYSLLRMHINNNMSSDTITVSTSLGQLRGKKAESVRGGQYFSFQGIPYAKPPVGQLRFQAPKPAEPWTGVRDALKEGSSCPSLHMITHEYIKSSSEDCLFLNVYTPDVKPAQKKAVLFWIHGGGFARGSGDTDVYGPDYIITEDVLLVTLNYRLGPLGFLSLQNKLCPGNNGLKDIVMALRWVKQNIGNFGGDPDRVTIFGESAGGAAVNYLMLSPLSKGLFHAAISQSGSVLNPWAYSRRPREFAFALGERLGHKTTDEKDLMNFFQTASVQDIVMKADAVQKIVDPDEGHASLAFVPTVEPEGVDGAFLTKKPADLIAAGQFHDVPYVVGAVSLEGLIIIVGASDLEKEDDYYKLIPADMGIDKKSDTGKEIVKRIKERYFKNGYDKRAYIDALSSIYFFTGIQRVIDGVLSSSTRKSPLYTYYYTFDGEKRLLKTLLNFGEYPGTCHGDELGYLFHVNILQAKLEPNTREYKAVEIITELWSNFAKTGNPTPNLDLAKNVNVKWEPATRSQRNYLHIDDDLTIGKDLLEDEKKFWYDLYELAAKVKKGKL